MGWSELIYRQHFRTFHLGYLLLLDAIDAEDPEFGTRGAVLLAAGLPVSRQALTASEDSDRFSKIIGPALRQVDYCILTKWRRAR